MIRLGSTSSESSSHALRAIAYYLPQFHPITENDRWWGKGFTDWRSTTLAKPAFHGHYQPRMPADLGYYDLRLAECRIAQAELATRYGIHGFCYYHYWFDGRRLLDRPLQSMLANPAEVMPFCIAWANEKWTARWTGDHKRELIGQNYEPGWDEKFMRDLLPVLNDRRYIRVGGRPLVLVCRPELMPCPQRVSERWRSLLAREGFSDPFLVAIQSRSIAPPSSYGFDAATEFSPSTNVARRYRNDELKPYSDNFRGLVLDYPSYVDQCIQKDGVDYEWFRCVMPGWDNTARQKEHATLFVRNSPSEYHRWLTQMRNWTQSRYAGDKQLIFINAWNEWAEGAYLEPDLTCGHAYLEATSRALR